MINTQPSDRAAAAHVKSPIETQIGRISRRRSRNHDLNENITPHQRAALLDQYYTVPKHAEHFYSEVLRLFDLTGYLIIEPSAGTGSFSKIFPTGSIALDIDPKSEGILKADFLKFEFPVGAKIAVIGNPPFGRGCNTAIRFFNYAASAAEIIAFVLPRTFRKASIQNRLDENFHLAHEIEVPNRAFIFEGKLCNVPSVFQIWVRGSKCRAQIDTKTTHPDFAFTEPSRASFAIQRVVGKAGHITSNLSACRSSHYFIKGNVKRVMAKLNFAKIAANTAGNPSLSKGEIVALYSEYCAKHPKSKNGSAS